MVNLNFLALAYLVAFFLRSATQIYLNQLQTSYLHRHGLKVPEFFQDAIDTEKLRKMNAYTIDGAKFGLVSALVGQALLPILLLSGFLPWQIKTMQPWELGLVTGGFVFFAVISLLAGLIHLPFSLYDTFVLEARYGFNTKTFKVWIADLGKGIILSALLAGVLLWLFLTLWKQGGNYWWVWAWILVGSFELLVMWLFPVWIAPLFNKFHSLENKGLEQRIIALMERAGLRAKGVFQMDASRRSRHTNAYFTGIGKTKRIVLFDTLLASHTEDEILAVLAHEIGHWKKRHVLKQLILTEGLSLAGFFLMAKLLNWPLLYQSFGLPEPIPYVGLFLLGVLFSPAGFFTEPFAAALSRKFEREADDFSAELLQTSEPLGHALKRLAADNLANLNPHPLYAWFYYSHPPLAERISRLQNSPPRPLRENNFQD